MGKNKVEFSPTVLVYGRDKANPEEYLGDYTHEDLSGHICKVCDAAGFEKRDEDDLVTGGSSLLFDSAMEVKADGSGVKTESTIEASDLKVKGDIEDLVDENGNLRKPEMIAAAAKGAAKPTGPKGDDGSGSRRPDMETEDMDIMKLLGEFAFGAELASHGDYGGFEFMDHHKTAPQNEVTFHHIVAYERQQELIK